MSSPDRGSVPGPLRLGNVPQPAVDLPLGFVPLKTVALLDPADELGALALDQIEIVIGELAPLLLHLAFQLFPISFYAIPIHGSLLPVLVVFLAGAGYFAITKSDVDNI